MSKAFLIKLLSVSLAIAISVTSSMVVLASSNANVMGELTVAGKNSSNGEVPFVLVNGERAQSGRTILSSTTVTTQDSSAVINFGQNGSVEIAPNSSLTLNISDSDVSGEVVSGKVKAFGALNSKIRTGSQTQTSGNKSAGGAWVIWALVFGGAAAALIYTASNSNSSSSLSGSTVISPTR